jgi:hypothetical protein
MDLGSELMVLNMCFSKDAMHYTERGLVAAGLDSFGCICQR